ncbi:MAG: YegP family protein [Saprospiraceae bacterium]|nr:YegP family protein [Saprospiraceae bacterium]
MNGYFSKFIDGAGQYRFNLKSGNHEIILKCSEGYSSSQACDVGIASVKANSPLDERYDRLSAKNGEYYFNLKARNGEIIGVSETYKTEQGRDEGIEDVKRIAPKAPVHDRTKSSVNV